MISEILANKDSARLPNGLLSSLSWRNPDFIFHGEDQIYATQIQKADSEILNILKTLGKCLKIGKIFLISHCSHFNLKFLTIYDICFVLKYDQTGDERERESVPATSRSYCQTCLLAVQETDQVSRIRICCLITLGK